MQLGHWIIAIVLCIGLVGCGGTSGPPSKPDGVEVSGKILLANGSPLTGGTLILRPVEGAYGATAQIQPNGTFTLMETSGQKSVVPGKYQVFVTLKESNHKALRDKVNKKYQSSEDGDSDVVVEIQQSISDLVIKLKP